ncbi:hypothetical protein [Subtercola sp. RTI3]|uniref:hypothetical protein n=1 Tax=Subtercola sp. RTI3 TaxID=3048639 RepID=UPI002B237F80|nr:hypothetical protein [Subtercola sp. RTI3]
MKSLYGFWFLPIMIAVNAAIHTVHLFVAGDTVGGYVWAFMSAAVLLSTYESFDSGRKFVARKAIRNVARRAGAL